MNSLDTNILLYATNADCSEHIRAKALVDRALGEPREWIVADQVYFELYRLLRNPVVLQHPLSAAQAWECLDFFRHRSGWMHCAYEVAFMDDLAEHLRSDGLAPRRTFDLVLAITLKRHGVATLYTRNAADFFALGWFSAVDPLAPAAGL